MKVYEFEWDEGNKEKNWVKHRVSRKECEEVFKNKPLQFFPDSKHSQSENRYAAYGKTNVSRYLTVVFTIRNEKIRIISARHQNKNERSHYENQKN